MDEKKPSLMDKLKAWALAHPAVEHLLLAIFVGEVDAIWTYVKSGLANTQTLSVEGIGSAATAALWMWWANNKTQVLAALQDKMEALQNAGQQTAAVTQVLNSVPPTKSSALTPVVLAIAFLGMSAPAFCQWQVPGDAFKLSKRVSLSPVNPSPAGENDLILMPTGNLGFALGTSSPAYGYSGAYDLILANVTQGTSADTVNVVPAFGVGVAAFVDFGPWINTNFQQPVLADFGINAIGPTVAGITPGVEVTWNLDSGERKVIVNGNVPLGPVAKALTFKVAQIGQ